MDASAFHRPKRDAPLSAAQPLIVAGEGGKRLKLEGGAAASGLACGRDRVPAREPSSLARVTVRGSGVVCGAARRDCAEAELSASAHAQWRAREDPLATGGAETERAPPMEDAGDSSASSCDVVQMDGMRERQDGASRRSAHAAAQCVTLGRRAAADLADEDLEQELSAMLSDDDDHHAAFVITLRGDTAGCAPLDAGAVQPPPSAGSSPEPSFSGVWRRPPQSCATTSACENEASTAESSASAAAGAQRPRDAHGGGEFGGFSPPAEVFPRQLLFGVLPGRQPLS